MGLLDRFLVPTDEVKFISETLAEYREIRKVYHYDYEPEDLKALQSCAKDLRPFTWSWVPAGITWYLSSKVVSTKGMSNAVRLTVGISRLMATWQVFRMGYLAGSYQQTTSCMKGLVSLPTPLGGEMVALIRSKNPEHPYLKLEQWPPGQEYSQEARPRIFNEQNRLAQLAKFKRELEAARGGQPVRRDAGEALEGVLQQRQDTFSGELLEPGDYADIMKHAQRSSSAGTASGVAAGQASRREYSPPGHLGNNEPRASRDSRTSSGQQPSKYEDDIITDDVLGMLGEGGGWFGDAEEAAESQKGQEQQERRERRRDRWGRLRRRSAEERVSNDLS